MKKKLVIILLLIQVGTIFIKNGVYISAKSTNSTSSKSTSSKSTTSKKATTNSNSSPSSESSGGLSDEQMAAITSALSELFGVKEKVDKIDNKSDISLNNEGALAQGQQTLYQGTVGAGGYTNTDVYSAINDVQKKRKIIDDYINMKYLTMTDLSKIKCAMYLSQFVEPLNGNLLNISKKLMDSEATGDIKLDDIIKDGNISITLHDTCQYIQDNYFVTKLYVQEDDNTYQVAKVKDLITSRKNGEIYIKDTNILSNDLELTTEELTKKLSGKVSQKDAKGYETVTGLTTGAATSKIANASNLSWLPFLDKSVRQQTDSTAINNVSINLMDSYIPVSTMSNAAKAAITIQINDYLRYNPDFKMSNFNSVFGSKELGMDSFGNLVCYDDGLFLMNVMLNPTLMAMGTKEKLNLSAYNIKCYYSGLKDAKSIQPNAIGIYPIRAKKGITIANSTNKWTTAIMDSKDYGKEKDAIFAVSYGDVGDNGTFTSNGYTTNSMINMSTSKLPSGEKTPSYHLQTIGGKLFNNFILKDPSTWKSKIKISTDDGRSETIDLKYEPSLIYIQGNNAKDSRGWFSKWWNGREEYEASGKFDWYYVRPLNDSNLYWGKNLSSNNSSFTSKDGTVYKEDFFGYRKKIFTFFKSDTDSKQQYSLYGYITKNMTSNDGGTNSVVYLPNLNKITQQEMVEFTKMYMGTGILNDVNLFKNWDKYQSYTLNYIKQMNNDALSIDSSRVKDKYTYPNQYLNTDDMLKDIAIIGAGIYKDLYKDIPIENSVLVGSDFSSSIGFLPIDYNNLLLSIVKNTNQTSKRLDSLTEISQQSAEEMKKLKVDDIIDRIWDFLENPVLTTQKFLGGKLQLWHVGMSSSSIQSLFYITGDDIAYWADSLIQKLLILSIIFFIGKLTIMLVRLLVKKEYTLFKFGKTFYVTIVLMTVPLIILNLTVQTIGWISDAIMQQPTLKYATVNLQQAIKISIPKQVAEDQNSDAITQYFIEHFDKSYQSSIAIQEVNTEVVDGFAGYDSVKVNNFDLAEVTDIIGALPNENDSDNYMYYRYGTKINGSPIFVSALQDNYDESVFYYFLDYYINLWCAISNQAGSTGDYSTIVDWQTQIQQDMYKSNVLKSYFNKRGIIYGDSSYLTNKSAVLGDIFGLGTLFYDDNTTPSTRGYYLPIEIMDTRLIDDVYSNTSTNNQYWSLVLRNKTFKDITGAQLNMLKTAKSSYLHAPVYTSQKLAITRPTISGTTVNPQIIAGKDTFVANNLSTKLALDLEKKLWTVNENIYKQACKYFDIQDSNISDYTNIIQLASLSTFEFNKEFCTDGILPWNKKQVLQTSYVKEKMDFDMIIKSIFKPDRLVTEDFDIMYELTLEGWGGLTAIVLIVAEFLFVIYLTLRILHLGIIYALGTVICTCAYGWKSDTKNKAWAGMAFQCFYFIVAHVIVVGSIAIITIAPTPKNTLFRTIFAAILAIGGLAGLYLEITQIIFLIKNAKDLGGEIVADKVSALGSEIKGKVQGLFNADNINVESDNLTSIDNPNKNIEENLDTSEEGRLKSQTDHTEKMYNLNNIDDVDSNFEIQDTGVKVKIEEEKIKSEEKLDTNYNTPDQSIEQNENNSDTDSNQLNNSINNMSNELASNDVSEAISKTIVNNYDNSNSVINNNNNNNITPNYNTLAQNTIMNESFATASEILNNNSNINNIEISEGNEDES